MQFLYKLCDFLWIMQLYGILGSAVENLTIMYWQKPSKCEVKVDDQGNISITCSVSKASCIEATEVYKMENNTYHHNPAPPMLMHYWIEFQYLLFPLILATFFNYVFNLCFLKQKEAVNLLKKWRGIWVNWQHRYMTWDNVQCVVPKNIPTHPMDGYWTRWALGCLKAQNF